MKKRFLSTLMALVLALSLVPTAALAAGEGDNPGETPAGVETRDDVELTGDAELNGDISTAVGDSQGNPVAEIDGTKYSTLAAAVNAVPDNGGETTVTLIDDIVMTTDDIVTISEGKTVTLDMDGHSITVDSDFSGRPIVNNGTLTVIGDGTIDSSNSTKGKGAITNAVTGILTVENGTFRGNLASEAANIWNYGTASFHGGTYDTSCTAVNGYVGSTTTITGGTYESPWYPAVDNSGNMTITGGEFFNTSCSGCDSNHWGYTIRSGFYSSDAHLDIKYATVTGTQGAVSVVGGTAEIHDGDFKTVLCPKEHDSAFYALYVAGESYKNAATVYGGTFTAATREALHVGNKNPAPDSGEGEESVVYVKGGTFIGGSGKQAIVVENTENAIGAATISGGTFSSNVSEYLASDVQTVQRGDEWVVGTEEDLAVAEVGGEKFLTLQKAIDAADDDETVTLLADVTESVTIDAGETIVLDLNGKELVNFATAQDTDVDVANRQHTITNNGKLTVIDSVGGGKVDNVSHGKGALVNYGTAELEGGTFTRSAEASTSPTDNGGNSWYVIDNQGTMTIDGATVINTGYLSSLIRNLGSKSGPAYLTVSRGLIRQDNFIALKNDNYGVLAVTGGTIISDEQALQNWSQAELSGGTFKGNVITWSYKEGTTSKTTISGDANITGNVIAVNYDGGNNPAAVEITGGTVVGEISKGTYNNGIVPAEPNATSSEIQVSGGNFSAEVNENYLDDTLNAQLKSASNTEAPYSYYTTMNAALAAAKPGDTVTAVNVAAGTNTYQVTFDYGDGRADTVSTVAYGTEITLPSPGTRSGYDFAGWYSGNTRYDEGDEVTVIGNMRFTASWSERNTGSDSEPSYSPVLDVSDGGTVRVSPRTPSEDDEVTITVDPDSGYEVGEVTVTDRNGREIDVTAGRNNTYTFTQPRGRVTIEVTFVREGSGAFFTDVPDTYWAYNEIRWAYDNGYVNGTSASTFSPGASISRQQVWMILARLSGQSPANMAEAQAWAVTNGISDGTTPGAAVTRQQLVALLYRYAQMMGYANEARVDLSSFPDAGSVASYAVEPMQWSVANSIVGGTTDGTLNPTGTATRAQFAVILYRFWSQIG